MAHDGVLDAAIAGWTASSRRRTFADVVSSAANRDSGKPPRVVAETVFVDDGHPFDLMKALAVRHDSRRQVGEVEIVELRDDEGIWHLVALPTEFTGVYHLVASVPTTHRRWQKVTRWITSAKDVSRCYLNHQDFESVALALHDFGVVEVVHASGRSAIDGSSTNRGFPARVKGGRRDPIDQIVEFEQQDTYTRSWALRVEDALYFHLRRIAGATFYSGRYRLFEEQVLGRLAAATSSRRDLLANRERRRATPVVPLSVVLADRVFNTREDTGLLIDVVQAMSDMSMAVFHRNPYLHFMLTDEHDGSNFDVLVTEPDVVDVFPGFRASAASLARITGKIAEEFGAVRIEEAPPDSMVSLADLSEV